MMMMMMMLMIPVTWCRVFRLDQALRVIIELAEGGAGARRAARQARLGAAPRVHAGLHTQVHGQETMKQRRY